MPKALLIGYLGKDPEMKYTPGGTAIATAGTIISLGLCAVLAGIIPAQRAASTDPVQALRTE